MCHLSWFGVKTQEYEMRKLRSSEGRRYCDPQVLTYQAERMPEQIRLKVGGVTAQQMAVYEEFSRNIPGFIPMGGSLSGELPTGTAVDSTSNTSHSTASYMVKPLPVSSADAEMCASNFFFWGWGMIRRIHSLQEGVVTSVSLILPTS